jgi:hypothetical protein
MLFSVDYQPFVEPLSGFYEKSNLGLKPNKVIENWQISEQGLSSLFLKGLCKAIQGYLNFYNKYPFIPISY